MNNIPDGVIDIVKTSTDVSLQLVGTLGTLTLSPFTPTPFGTVTSPPEATFDLILSGVA